MTTAPRTLSRRAAVGTGLAGLAATSIAPSLARAQGATPAAPDDGITADGIARGVAALDGIVADAQERTGVPGIAVAVVAGDEPLATRGYGVASTETGAPIDADTIFQLASLSKPVASTVVASIVGEGIVDWDTPVVAHLPEFALHEPYPTREATIRDMFCHRSGLPGHAGDLLEDLGYEREEVLHRLRLLPPASSFRAGYAYTNFGLTAGAVAASTAAGQAWEEASAARLYEPAGMTRTSSRFDDYAGDDNRALTHVEIDGAWVPEYTRDADAQSPAGGVSSTATDIAQWMRLQLGGGTLAGEEIVDAAALAETHVPHIVSSPPGAPVGFYGLGWNVNLGPDGLRLGHSGAFALGAGTAVTLLPGDGLGITVLTNGFPLGVAESISAAFLDMVRTGTIQRDYITLIGEIFTEEMEPEYGDAVAGTPPADAQPPEDLAIYAGSYDNPYFGAIEVSVDDDGLAIALGPRPDVYALEYWNRDTFTYLPIGENQNHRSAVTFTFGADGAPSRVWIENLDLHGMGTFTRTDA